MWRKPQQYPTSHTLGAFIHSSLNKQTPVDDDGGGVNVYVW